MDENMNPIIVLGAPRSGTTLLGDVLSCDPSVYYAIEPSPLWRFGNEKFSDCLQPEWATEKIREYIINSFKNRLLESGKTRLLEKTPQNCLRPDFVDSVLQGARFVHVIRNGYESTLSINKFWETNTRGFTGVRFSQRLKEMTLSQIPRYSVQFVKRILGQFLGDNYGVYWGPRIPGGEQVLRERGSLYLSALQWRMCVESACQFGQRIGPARYMEVKLEEMTVDTINEIADFLELGEGSDFVLEAYKSQFQSASVAHRKRDANLKDIAIIRELIEPTMQWLDYD